MTKYKVSVELEPFCFDIDDEELDEDEVYEKAGVMLEEFLARNNMTMETEAWDALSVEKV
jgi:hypothetical protein